MWGGAGRVSFLAECAMRAVANNGRWGSPGGKQSIHIPRDRHAERLRAPDDQCGGQCGWLARAVYSLGGTTLPPPHFLRSFFHLNTFPPALPSASSCGCSLRLRPLPCSSGGEAHPRPPGDIRACMPVPIDGADGATDRHTAMGSSPSNQHHKTREPSAHLWIRAVQVIRDASVAMDVQYLREHWAPLQKVQVMPEAILTAFECSE